MPATEPADRSGRAVVVTGADSNYYGYMLGTIRSLAVARRWHGFDIVALDFGLTSDQIEEMARDHDVRTVQPQWMFDCPQALRLPRNHAYGARCYLPRVVPGYGMYLWIDSDAWVQEPGFYEAFTGPAADGRLVIVNEREPVYPLEWRLVRWNLGNMVLGYGVVGGLRMYLGRQINNGVFALRGDSPVWDLWSRRFERAVARTGNIIHDQHSLLAAIVLDGAPVTMLGGAYNWICSRALPRYDLASQRFCLPYPPHAPIQVMHLAGPGKGLGRDILTLEGGTIHCRLTHGGVADA